jgi:hypothetical protein
MKQQVTLDLEVIFAVSTHTDPVPTVNKNLGKINEARLFYK